MLAFEILENFRREMALIEPLLRPGPPPQRFTLREPMNAILTALLLVPHAADLLNLALVPRQLHGLRRMIELLQRHHQPPKPQQGPKSLGISYLALVPDHKRDSDGKPLPVEKDEDGRTWIEPGETMTFVGRPQVKFSIHSLLVSWRALSDAKLALVDLTMGNVSALAACGELSLTLFADGCKARIPLPQPEIHYPGHTIVARISNPGKVRCPVILGASVEMWEESIEGEGIPFPGTFDEENEGPSMDVNLPPDSLWTAAQGKRCVLPIGHEALPDFRNHESRTGSQVPSRDLP